MAANTEESERQRRKRLQNRLNQRARRNRLKASSGTPAPTPYTVRRWRIADDEPVSAEEASPEPNTREMASPGSPSTEMVLRTRKCIADMLAKTDLLRVSAMMQQGDSPSLSQDRLIRLMTYNVFRGIFTNKTVLSLSAQHLALLPSGPTAVDIMAVKPGEKVLMHGTDSTPISLRPTPLQNRVPHPAWIDIVPFARMREALIIHQQEFDHHEFVRDAVGDAMDWMVDEAPDANPVDMPHTELSRTYDDSVTTSRSGFILWGEPHDPSSWEATPSFLRKWGWTVRGCPELIRATNKWRAERGEKEIPVAQFNSL